jgi:hypothetical protein
LATQAAKKKAKLSKLNSSEKKATNEKSGSKSNRQPSIEEVEDVDDTRQRVFLQNPRNIIESSDDDDDDEATRKATNLNKPTLSQKKKTHNKSAPKLNRQPSVEDVDDPADNMPRVFPRNPRNILESNEEGDDEVSNFPAISQATCQDVDGIEDSDGEDEVEVVEQPAESADAELS